MTVNVSQFLSDNTVTLSCLINLPSTVNDGEMVNVTWFGPTGELANISSVTVSNTYATATRNFQSDVTISSYVPAIHNGEYTCNGTVIPSGAYVIGNSNTDTQTVILSG